jgi:hypothetical protein
MNQASEDVIEVAGYPFVRTVFEKQDFDGEEAVTNHLHGWKPGCESEYDQGFSVIYSADGMGEMLLTVVSRHKPGRYPERVFYTRQWRDPDGKVFGNLKLRIATAQKFKQLSSGYRDEFEMRGVTE